MHHLIYKFPYLKNCLVILAFVSFSMVYAQKLEWIIPPQYGGTSIRLGTTCTVDAFIYIKNKGKWGLLDYTGKTVLPIQFDTIYSLSPFLNYAIVGMGDKYGIYSMVENKYLAPPTFDYLFGEYMGNTLMFKQKEKWGVVDFSGKILVEPKYESLVPNTQKLVWESVTIDNELNAKRTVIYSIPQETNIAYPHYRITDKEEPMSLTYPKANYIVHENPNGTDTLPPAEEIQDLFNDSTETVFYYFNDKIKLGLIDKNSKPILPCEYDMIDESVVGDGLWVAKDKLCGVYDLKKREMVVPLKYHLKGCNNGYCIFSIKNDQFTEKYGVLDTQFKEIIPAEYDNIQILPHCFILTKGNKSGVFAKNDLRQILPFEYEVKSRESSSMVWLCRDGLWGLARIGF
jgi:hypothetical protein